jgi:hypothetical protein
VQAFDPHLPGDDGIARFEAEPVTGTALDQHRAAQPGEDRRHGIR